MKKITRRNFLRTVAIIVFVLVTACGLAQSTKSFAESSGNFVAGWNKLNIRMSLSNLTDGYFNNPISILSIFEFLCQRCQNTFTFLFISFVHIGYYKLQNK